VGEIGQRQQRTQSHPASTLVGGVAEDALRAAVGMSRSWRGVLRQLQLTSSRQARMLQADCDRLGIDYGHFGTRAWSDAQLREALGAAGSWADVLAALGYADDSGSARATIRKHATRLGLDLTPLSGRPRPMGDDPFASPPDARHLRAAGAYLVAGACALLGYKVSWPLEPTRYDLLVDTGGDVQRVQVKTTAWRLDGAWACKITHRQSAQTAWYTKQDIDYFGVVDGDQRVYMIPVEVVDGTGTIIVRHYDSYRLQPL
jgi:hypothetical protein